MRLKHGPSDNNDLEVAKRPKWINERYYLDVTSMLVRYGLTDHIVIGWCVVSVDLVHCRM